MFLFRELGRVAATWNREKPLHSSSTCLHVPLTRRHPSKFSHFPALCRLSFHSQYFPQFFFLHSAFCFSANFVYTRWRCLCGHGDAKKAEKNVGILHKKQRSNAGSFHDVFFRPFRSRTIYLSPLHVHIRPPGTGVEEKKTQQFFQPPQWMERKPSKKKTFHTFFIFISPFNKFPLWAFPSFPSR